LTSERQQAIADAVSKQAKAALCKSKDSKSKDSKAQDGKACQGRGPSRSILARSDVPATNCITIQGDSSCSATSWIVITPGWSSRAAACATRIVRATSPARSPGDWTAG
jgi:hypothetical protein